MQLKKQLSFILCTALAAYAADRDICDDAKVVRQLVRPIPRRLVMAIDDAYFYKDENDEILVEIGSFRTRGHEIYLNVNVRERQEDNVSSAFHFHWIINGATNWTVIASDILTACQSIKPGNVVFNISAFARVWSPEELHVG